MRERRITRTQPNSNSALTSNKKASILAPPELKSRKWVKTTVKVGNLYIPKWMPSVDRPTEALQQYNVSGKRLIGKKGRKKILPDNKLR